MLYLTFFLAAVSMQDVAKLLSWVYVFPAVPGVKKHDFWKNYRFSLITSLPMYLFVLKFFLF